MESLIDIFQPEDSIEMIMKKAEAFICENPTDENKKQYADLLLDIVIAGEFRYLDPKEIKKSIPFREFLKLSNEIKNLSPLHKAIIDFFMERHNSVLISVKKWFESSVYRDNYSPLNCDNFVYALVLPFKEAFPGFWTEIANMMDKIDVQPGIKEMAIALESVYYSKDNDEIIDALSLVLQKNDSIHLAKELLGYTYYNMQLWKNAIAYLEPIYSRNDINGIFFLDDISFWIAWSYGKTRNYQKEESYYRKSLETNPELENSLNNLGYCLYKQKKYGEAKSTFEECLVKKRDFPYCRNNMIRVLLAMGQYSEAQAFVESHKGKVAKDLVRRVEKTIGKKDSVILPSDAVDVNDEDDNSEIFSTLPLGVTKQQFVSEKILEDELICRFERGYDVFGKQLSVYEAFGAYGRQFIIPIGRLDILAIDRQNNLYVIELKKDSGYDDPFEQTIGYIEWLEKNMVIAGQKVHGIICLNSPTQGLIEKVRRDKRIQLFEYCISYNKVE